MTEIELQLELERVKQYRRHKRRKGRFSKLLVVIIFLLIAAYTSVVLWFSMNMWVVPDSLTMAFFAAMIGEFSALGVIKNKRIKGGKTSENS